MPCSNNTIKFNPEISTTEFIHALEMYMEHRCYLTPRFTKEKST